jgi:hypothetical protein
MARLVEEGRLMSGMAAARLVRHTAGVVYPTSRLVKEAAMGLVETVAEPGIPLKYLRPSVEKRAQELKRQASK